MPSIIQFFHPRADQVNSKQSSVKIEWNEGVHRRKFLISRGSYIENDIKSSGRLLFYGEWEPTSYAKRLTKLDTTNPYEEYPEYVHYPYIPPGDIIRSKYQRRNSNYQNTDPFVFGEKFKYSICMQDHFQDLKNLEDGSLILFGSCVNDRFAIDTVFVVKGSAKYCSPRDQSITNLLGNDTEIYREVVLKMACDKSLPANRTVLTLYTGATYEDTVNGMYSFVPAMKDEKKGHGFPRYVMPGDFYGMDNKNLNRYFSKWEINDGIIYEVKNQGIKATADVSIDDIKCFWDYLKEGVAVQKFVLGCKFEMPTEYDLMNA